MIEKRKIALILSCVFATSIFLSGCGSTDSSAGTASKTSLNSTTNITSTSSASTATSTGSTAADKTENPLWKVVADATAEHANFAAGFINEKSGITVGYAGEIHYTTDGGKTWPASTNNSACRWGLDIVNESLAWCCGNSGNIRVSKDLGQSWDAVSDCKGPCKFISFIDDKTGWVANTDWLQVTSDSGKTWKDITIPSELNSIAAINLFSTTDGYILNSNGMLYSTKDGGKTWSAPQDLGIKNLKIDNKSIPSATSACAAIRFTDSNNGIIIFSGVSGADGGNVWLLKTADSGKTWTTQELNVNKLYYQSTVYLSHDGKYLTLRNELNKIEVLLLK